MTSTSKRGKAIRIALFNHKGGVGKTTLTVNIAYALKKLGKRVLLVDADPQCNLSAYYLPAEDFDKFLDDADKPEGNTLWSGIFPVIDSNAEPKKLLPLGIEQNLLLLHGDLKLSTYEQELAGAWTECFQRKSRGLKSTAALSSVVSAVATRFSVDYVFFDIGPNIGPLNRAVLLDCDYFIIPTACDLFSLRALTTLGRTIATWVTDWKIISSIAPSSNDLLPGFPKFLGYVPQRFRVYRGGVTSGHASLISRIQRAVGSEIVNVLRATDPNLAPPPSQDVRIGQVKDFNQLASQSQLEGVAIENCSKASDEQRRLARDIFDGMARRIVRSAK
jgi:cellulose biosynthesis protein BcsQ